MMANTGLLDPEFDVRVRAMAAAAREAGYNPQMTSGFRGPGDQARAIDSVSRNVNGRPASIMEFARGIPGYAAPVGGSQHEKGTAVDWGTGPALDWMRQNAPRYGVEFPKSLARTDPIHSQINSGFYGPVQDPRDRGVDDGGPSQPTASAGRAAAPIASQGRQQMTEPTGFGGLLSNFASGLQSGMQSRLFQEGLGTFNEASKGTNWAGALMAGGEAANKASQAQLAQAKAQREMAQQKLRDKMWGDITSGQQPAWATGLPAGTLDLARALGPDAGAQLLTQMMTKNADRDLDIRRLDQQQSHQNEQLKLQREQMSKPQFNAETGGYFDPATKSFVPLPSVTSKPQIKEVNGKLVLVKPDGSAVEIYGGSSADDSKKIGGTLNELATIPNRYDSFDQGVGSFQGGDMSVVSPLARAWGSVMSTFKATSPSEVRRVIDGTSETLAATIKPMIRKPGEGTWTDADQKRLDYIVGDLKRANNVGEYNRGLEEVKRRVEASFNLKLPPITLPVGNKSQGKANADQVRRISGDADYDAVQSGELFIGPDGKTRRKP